ncbi:hypothetical protein DSO57_1031752 [Entomophthora muscae]|uniref:Uncharacterized protein n=1 Tax=Entomophthora muscae TaxID=34485 RepID=A0ACC2UBE5_9FUNG|nr:hypothetical protein DSO57_1031752 [Entomophthora muscae]
MCQLNKMYPNDLTLTHSIAVVATKFPALPANVSYNTQGALNEPPLGVSNIMN